VFQSPCFAIAKCSFTRRGDFGRIPAPWRSSPPPYPLRKKGWVLDIHVPRGHPPRITAAAAHVRGMLSGIRQSAFPKRNNTDTTLIPYPPCFTNVNGYISCATSCRTRRVVRLPKKCTHNSPRGELSMCTIPAHNTHFHMCSVP